MFAQGLRPEESCAWCLIRTRFSTSTRPGQKLNTRILQRSSAGHRVMPPRTEYQTSKRSKKAHRVAVLPPATSVTMSPKSFRRWWEHRANSCITRAGCLHYRVPTLSVIASTVFRYRQAELLTSHQSFAIAQYILSKVSNIVRLL